MWQGLTLLKPMERRLMLGIYLTATSVSVAAMNQRAHVVNPKATILAMNVEGYRQHFRKNATVEKSEPSEPNLEGKSS
ncbi:hypothetical protein Tco_0540252 [Tanacetum coccineum]